MAPGHRNKYANFFVCLICCVSVYRQNVISDWFQYQFLFAVTFNERHFGKKQKRLWLLQLRCYAIAKLRLKVLPGAKDKFYFETHLHTHIHVENHLKQLNEFG